MQLSFPGGSKKRVNKAGDRIAAGEHSAEDISVIDEWRSAHKAVLNTFQASLRNRTRGTKIVVAQRHKRKNTIVDKLQRFPGMKLARMDDVAGCRLIFSDIQGLDRFREKFHRANLITKCEIQLISMTILRIQKILDIGAFMTSMNTMFDLIQMRI